MPQRYCRASSDNRGFMVVLVCSLFALGFSHPSLSKNSSINLKEKLLDIIRYQEMAKPMIKSPNLLTSCKCPSVKMLAHDPGKTLLIENSTIHRDPKPSAYQKH